MKIHVRWNVTDLTSVDGDLVRKHTRCRNLDGISPVVVVVAESVGEVQDCILGYLGCVGSDIEMSWFYSSLSHRVRNKEKVEGSIHDF